MGASRELEGMCKVPTALLPSPAGRQRLEGGLVPREAGRAQASCGLCGRGRARAVQRMVSDVELPFRRAAKRPYHTAVQRQAGSEPAVLGPTEVLALFW